jgi:hypothetical protein
MEDSERDPRDILEQLTAHHATLRWAPQVPSDALLQMDERPVQSESSMAFVHANWNLPRTLDQIPASPGIRGRFIRMFARLTLRVMGRRLDEEQELIAALVEATGILARRCDELTAVLATYQVQEAANQARLAGWLDASPPDHS